MWAAVLVSRQGAGLRTIEAYSKVVENRCSMTLWGFMDTFPYKPFQVSVLYVMARPSSWLKVMIVAYASSAPACIIHAKENEAYMLKNTGQSLTQCDNSSPDPTVKFVCFRQQEPCPQQMDYQEAVKQLDKNLHNEWQYEIVIPDVYFTFREKFTRALEHFEGMWDGNLCQLKRYSSESNWSRQTAKQSNLLLIVPTGRQYGSKIQKSFKCFSWKLSSPCTRNWPHLLS